MSEKKTATLQIPVPIQLAEDLKKLAKLDERSMAVYCKRALQQHVEATLGINTREMQMEELRKNFLGHALINNGNNDDKNTKETLSEANVKEIKNNETKKKKRPGKMMSGI